ncbi:MAG: hypothetical protein LBL31_02315 [Spirochaetaceae bacterium]|jgi:hypothetical protein|nr:hypothetical protein [Spirochaetaceae bacterium]
MDLTMLMMVLMAGHWIPTRQEEFIAFCRVWLEDLMDEAKVAAFKWDKPTVMTVRASLNGVLSAWETYQETPSTYNRTIKDGMIKQAKHDMEDFADKFIRFNDNMTEADKNRLGIYARKPASRIEPPKTAPVLEPHPGTPGQIVVPYHDESSLRRGKPPKTLGIKIHWDILPHPPASRSELTNVAIDTDSPFHLSFDEKDRGKRVYMYGCWIIEREGEEGPPSEIVSCFVG